MLWIIKQLLKLSKKQDLLNILIADKFCLVTKDDILTLKDSKLTYQGKVLDDYKISQLISESQKFEESFLWKVLKTEIHYQAGLKILEKANKEESLIAGKETIYLLDTIQTKLDSLDEYNKKVHLRQKTKIQQAKY